MISVHLTADCHSAFISPRNIDAAAAKLLAKSMVDPAFENLIEDMKSNKSKIWNKSMLLDTYIQFGGEDVGSKTLIKRILTKLSNQLVVMPSNGYSNLIFFKSGHTNLLKMTKVHQDEDETQITLAARHLGKQIFKETTAKNKPLQSYTTDLNALDIEEEVSESLLLLLDNISPNL